MADPGAPLEETQHYPVGGHHFAVQMFAGVLNQNFGKYESKSMEKSLDRRVPAVYLD